MVEVYYPDEVSCDCRVSDTYTRAMTNITTSIPPIFTSSFPLRLKVLRLSFRPKSNPSRINEVKPCPFHRKTNRGKSGTLNLQYSVASNF